MARNSATVGDIVSLFLTACDVDAAFGVVSVHNMPILDAISRRNKIRFIASRGEAGAVNGADAYARVSGKLGVAITSTGTGAGNAAGAMIEAMSASTPLLHITGQIDSSHLDKGRGFIHEHIKQPEMLRGISKAAFRTAIPNQVLGVLREAVRIAMTPPMGPVSVELPIDLQYATVAMPEDFAPLTISAQQSSTAGIARFADRLAAARRPLILLGGGTRKAADPARRLADIGLGIVTSTHGRGVVPESHPMTLGAFLAEPEVEQFYSTCDAMLLVGSKPRSNDTKAWNVKLPKPLLQVDVDPMADGRNYSNDDFLCGDAAHVLDALAARLRGKIKIDPAFASDLASVRESVRKRSAEGWGDYAPLFAEFEASVPPDLVWVRDVTVSTASWGNRCVRMSDPLANVHALGAGIGQGLAMSIGAAVAAPSRKTVCLSGDGGFMLNLGELATAVQEKLNITFVLMNDGGYGVIRNIQDARFGSRQLYSDLFNPSFALLAKAFGISHHIVQTAKGFGAAFRQALAHIGPAIVEVDMRSVGEFKTKFTGLAPAKSAA